MGEMTVRRRYLGTRRRSAARGVPPAKAEFDRACLLLSVELGLAFGLCLVAAIWGWA